MYSGAGNPHFNFTDHNASFSSDQQRDSEQELLESFSIQTPDPFSESDFSNLFDTQVGNHHDPYTTSPRNSYPNLNAHTSHPDYRNATSVTGFGEDPLANSSSTQFTSFDPNAGNIPVEPGPTMTPHMASMPSHYYASIASYFPEFYAPILSNDGISTMPDPEDLLPLDFGQPLPLPINKPSHSNAPSQLRLEDPLPAQPSRKRRQGTFIPFDPRQKRVRGWAAAEVGISCYEQTTND